MHNVYYLYPLYTTYTIYPVALFIRFIESHYCMLLGKIQLEHQRRRHRTESGVGAFKSAKPFGVEPGEVVLARYWRGSDVPFAAPGMP